MNVHVVRAEFLRLMRFACVGAGVALIYYVTSVAVVATGLGNPLIATTVGSIVSVFASYFGHMHLSFGVEPNHGRFVWRFMIAATASYGFNLVLTWFLMDWLKLPYALGFAIVTLAVPIWTYVVTRWWVFSQSSSQEVAMMPNTHEQ